MRRLIPLLLLFFAVAGLGAQSSLAVSGLNEAVYIYRTAQDSLHSYFRDSFAFGLSYRNFSLGMKFVAELPKYSTSQSELLDELLPQRLSLGWEELYASFTKDAYLIYAGTLAESFGQGLVFRSFEDLEFDTDNRITGFKFGYDDILRLKALYGAIESPVLPARQDLAYGLDAEYPVWGGLSLGGSALALRNYTAFNTYSESDVFAGRLGFANDWVEARAEYAARDYYGRGPGLPQIAGDALYGTLSFSFGPLQIGGAYKNYHQFQYRLQDLPLANHHNETLADNQGSGLDEEGAQGWLMLGLGEAFSLNLDYAEAWNAARELRMSDAYAALDYARGSFFGTLSYSQVEKVDDALSHWQKESYPGFSLSFPLGQEAAVLAGEFKLVNKQRLDAEWEHYEPKLQLDLTLGKLGLSLGGQSWWADFSSLTDSRYWANMELKYPILSGTELVLFGGSEAGGKVCRNGVCRYVAPFSGLRLELNTRF